MSGHEIAEIILFVVVFIVVFVIEAFVDSCPYAWTSMCLDCPMGGKYKGCVFTGEVDGDE